jgi:hypothetical protein
VTSAATDPVNLRTAEDYVILTKSGISTVPDSAITGKIAVSPIAATAMTGFTLIANSGGTYSESSQLTGKAYAANYATPIPAHLTAAVSNMELAYTDAKSRPGVTANTNIGLGVLGVGDVATHDSPLTPGVYTFGSGVNIDADIYFDGQGDPDAVFIVRMTGNLEQVENTQVILDNDAQAKNIFWQVAGNVKVFEGANLKGILLVKTDVSFMTGSSLDGRVLSQTACNLQEARITQPSTKGTKPAA